MFEISDSDIQKYNAHEKLGTTVKVDAATFDGPAAAKRHTTDILFLLAIM